MRKITLTNEPKQSFTIPFEDFETRVTVKFLTVSRIWVMDVEDSRGMKLNNYKLSVNVQHLKQNNTPYDFTIIDKSALGVDPFHLENFERDDYAFYLLEREDTITLRGYDVY